MAIKSDKALIRNTFFIAISNLGSRAISFVMAPLYSYYLSVEQYGTMDLITTSAGLLLPFLCLDVYEASFRFANDDEYDTAQVISTSLFICIWEVVIVLSFVCMLYILNPNSGIIILSCLYAVIDSVYCVLAYYARGRGKMKQFAFSGIINSISLLFLNVLFLITLRLQLKGWVISFFLAKCISVVYLLFDLRIVTLFSFKKVDKHILHYLLEYCLPLMPSTAMWWIMNASDRYMISFFIGISATGIYAVGNKLPSILGVFESVFYQAWQTTAVGISSKTDKSKVYSDVFVNYFRFLTLGVLGILIVLKPMIFGLFAVDYNDAYICSAVLVVSVMIHALAGNLGILYTVYKDTKGALKTSAIGALVNLVLNAVFIPWLGMNSAAVTTLVAYLVVLIIRLYDSRKFTRILIDVDVIAVYVFFIILQLFLYYQSSSYCMLGRIIVFFIVLFKERELIRKLLKL